MILAPRRQHPRPHALVQFSLRHHISLGLLVVVATAAAQTVVPTGSMNEPRADFAATTLNNGMVLVTGGSPGAGANISRTAELYDPALGTWRYTTSQMAFGRTHHTSTKLSDGRVLITGGLTTGTAAEIFDPATERFTSVRSMNLGHGAHQTVLLNDGRAFVIGGGTPQCEVYNPVTDTWTIAQSIPVPSTDATNYPLRHSAVLLEDGQVLISGGYGFEPLFVYRPDVYLYNPQTNVWRVMTPMFMARVDHSMTLLPGGKVLIAGGGTGTASTNTVEIYDPSSGANGASQFGPSMVEMRQQHSATRLPTGDVVIAGGLHGPPGTVQTYISSVQVFRVSNQSWSVPVSLATPRGTHKADLLQNGDIVLMGGFNGPNYLNSAELVKEGPKPAPMCSPTSPRIVEQITGFGSCPPTGKKSAQWGQFGVSDLLRSDAGETLELECSTVGENLIAFQLFYSAPTIPRVRVGGCPFNGGCNFGWFSHSGKNPLTGNPRCFTSTTWISKDYWDNDKLPNPFTGDLDAFDTKLDWAMFTFNAPAKALTKTSYKWTYNVRPPLTHFCEDYTGPRPEGTPVEVQIVDPPIGTETEAYFDAVLRRLSLQPATGEPMQEARVSPGDLSGDGKVDAVDFDAFRKAFGSCKGNLSFNPLADLDGDGCVGLVDYQIWYQFYTAATKR